MTVPMVFAFLSGCSGNKLKYEIQNNSIVAVTGTINWDSFKRAELIRVKNQIAEIDEYYLAIHYEGRGYNQYVDLETNKIVYNEYNSDFENFTVEVVLDGMVDYLYKYKMVYDEYDIDDIVAFKECLLNDETLFPALQGSKINSKKRSFVRNILI